jgi:hypothetical protein
MAGGVGLLTVGLTAAVVYLIGASIIPTADVQLSPSDPISEPPTVQDLSGTRAVLVVAGDREALLELNRVTVGEYNPGQVGDTPIDLSLTYQSSEASFLLLTHTGRTSDRGLGGGSSRMGGIQLLCDGRRMHYHHGNP